MRGHGEKLTRKQEAAIAALLSCPTVGKAACAAGVSEATLWRWLQVDDFRRAYHAARRQVVENALGAMQRATGEAVETLRRNLTCGSPAVEVQAARAIMEQSIRAVELVDLAERVEALESTIPQRPARVAGIR